MFLFTLAVLLGTHASALPGVPVPSTTVAPLINRSSKTLSFGCDARSYTF